MWRVLGFAWRRAGDASLVAWLWPTGWATFVTVAAVIGTSALGLLSQAPVFLWVPAALAAGVFALVLVHLWRRFRPIHVTSHRLAFSDAQVPLPVTEAAPDWPIRKLFFHVNPDILETSEQDEFDETCQVIEDQFSTGQLLCWGREIDGSRRLPLALIPAAHWQHLKLIPWLLDSEEKGGRVLQADRRKRYSPVPQYTDLYVSHAQALRRWPKVDVAAKLGGGDALPHSEFISLRDAAARLYGQLRGSEIAKRAEERSGTGDGIILNFFGELLARHIPLSVRKSPSPYWEDFDRESLSKMKIWDGATSICFAGGDHRVYFSEIKLRRSAFEAALPDIVSFAKSQGDALTKVIGR